MATGRQWLQVPYLWVDGIHRPLLDSQGLLDDILFAHDVRVLCSSVRVEGDVDYCV